MLTCGNCTKSNAITRNFAKILDAQFTDEKTAIEGEITGLRQQLDGINAQIKNLALLAIFPREFLDRHSALKAEIDALKNQNQAFPLTQNELQAAKANADAILKRSIEDILRNRGYTERKDEGV